MRASVALATITVFAGVSVLASGCASSSAPAAGRGSVTPTEYLQDHGVMPALWEVEGLDRPDDAVAVAAAAKRGGRTADCIVLGRHDNHDHHLDRWLQVAAPVPGFTGFAIGRSIWWDPLHAHLHHRSTAGGTRRRIASIYSDFVRYFLDARDGTLPVQDEPEVL